MVSNSSKRIASVEYAIDCTLRVYDYIAAYIPDNFELMLQSNDDTESKYDIDCYLVLKSNPSIVLAWVELEKHNHLTDKWLNRVMHTLTLFARKQKFASKNEITFFTVTDFNTVLSTSINSIVTQGIVRIQADKHQNKTENNVYQGYDVVYDYPKSIATEGINIVANLINSILPIYNNAKDTEFTLNDVINNDDLILTIFSFVNKNYQLTTGRNKVTEIELQETRNESALKYQHNDSDIFSDYTALDNFDVPEYVKELKINEIKNNLKKEKAQLEESILTHFIKEGFALQGISSEEIIIKTLINQIKNVYES